jgi:hypothetical protein
MLDYAQITGGWFAQIRSDGTYLEDALLQMVYGELPAYLTPIPASCP